VGDPADGIAVRAAAAAQVFVADPARPVLGAGDLHHLEKVLRLRRGEVVVASDGRGAWCLCRFGGGGVDGALALEPDAEVRREPPEEHPVTVAFAPAKGDRPEWVVQKLTELGVDRLVVLAADRSVVRWEGPRAERSVSRLERVAVEAAAQSRRVFVPEILGPQSLRQLAEDSVGLALAERGGGPAPAALSLLAVGPEGGWSPGERALGLATVGLAEHVLRAETAAVAAAVVLCAGRSSHRA
jgi:16S rRNA (uracil1498-N3)-methyltransferase